jgi:hypothetical protein
MTYVHITITPGRSLQTYHEVISAMGPQPVAGLASRYAGDVDGTLIVLNIFQSQTDADRFAAERLFPAYEQLSLPTPPNSTVLAFVAADPVVSSD